MKLIKRLLLSVLILFILIFSFRAPLYRNLITYQSLGERTSYIATNSELINYIEEKLESKAKLEIEEIIKTSLKITSERLEFSQKSASVNPNRLINSHKTHCIGYAAYFTTVCNYLLKKNGLSYNWKAKHQIGQLFLFGENIHHYFESGFFLNHDFVSIENKATRKVFAVDPSVNDYLLTDYITFEVK